jgi:hypothetical protein
MPNHLPPKAALGAIANLSSDILVAVMSTTPGSLGSPEDFSEISRRAYQLAQTHIEYCLAVHESVEGQPCI